jgi:hypothetical protein
MQPGLFGTGRVREVPAGDPSSSVDTPLPPVLDPAHFDDTARHPMAEPLLDGLAAAANLKLLKGEEKRAEPAPAPRDEESGDDMSKTLQAPAAARPAPRKTSARGGKKKAVRRYRPRSANLEIAPDPAPTPSFGDGILAVKQRKPFPWPYIGGVAVLLLLLAFFFTR